MNTKIDELFAALRGLIADQTSHLAIAMAELASVAAERDKLKLAHQIAACGWNKAALERDNVRYIARAAEAAEAERDNARQSLRAAEQDLAETESVNSDLRTVNARLVADLAAATERLNHAKSILMQ